MKQEHTQQAPEEARDQRAHRSQFLSGGWEGMARRRRRHGVEECRRMDQDNVELIKIQTFLKLASLRRPRSRANYVKSDYRNHVSLMSTYLETSRAGWIRHNSITVISVILSPSCRLRRCRHPINFHAALPHTHTHTRTRT